MLFPCKPPAYFYYGERLEAIWHTRLRLGNSTLPCHGHLYGFTDSNLCSCGSKEDTEHFFLSCPKYAAPRIELLTSIANLIAPGVHHNLLLHVGKTHLLNTILRGSSDLSSIDNLLLFQAVHVFLRNTRRFEYIMRL